jgi:hypothetical protein
MRRLFRLVSILALTTTYCAATGATIAAANAPEMAVFEGTSQSDWSDYGIWASSVDGSNPQRIGEGEEPALSPDGLEVAYVEPWSQCIDVMGISGGHSEAVYCDSATFFGPEEVTWSPNGFELAFSKGGSEGLGIYVYNLATDKLRTVANWFFDQEAPSFSPDGSQIAFGSIYNLEEEWDKGIWVVNSDGTGLHQLTNEGQTEPAWSPDGSQIAVAAYDEEDEEDWGAIALLNSSTGVVEKWLLGEDGPQEFDPHWTTDGETISYGRYDEEGPSEVEEEKYEIGEINVDGTDERYLFPDFRWSVWFSPRETTGGLEFDPSYLLTRYEPRLHFDLQEQYFADSAAEATNGPENRILTSDKETVLAAHELGYPTPSLSLLSEPEFAYGVLDEGPEYAEDASYLHANSEYANRAYGRVFQDPETGAYWLDYWFYYYYDSQEVLGIGIHEGDWEHVAFRLNEEGIPDLAIYSRHGSESAACESSAVEWEVSDVNTVSPNVYVANGSHANYFWAGEHGREFPLPTDDANGDGATITPEVFEVESAPYTSTTALPQWFYWSGKWGASGGGGFDQESPSSPARDSDEWENLQAFAEASEENCDATGSGEKAATRQQGSMAQSREEKLPQPAEPEITARSSKDGVAIHYAIPKGAAPAKYLLLSISAKDRLDAIRTKTIELQTDHGVAHLPRPLAAGPYVVAGSTFTGSKERSKTQVANVQQ